MSRIPFHNKLGLIGGYGEKTLDRREVLPHSLLVLREDDWEQIGVYKTRGEAESAAARRWEATEIVDTNYFLNSFEARKVKDSGCYANVVRRYNVSGGQTISVMSNGRESSRCPFPIALQIIDDSVSHLVCINRDGAKDLIRYLLEVI